MAADDRLIEDLIWRETELAILKKDYSSEPENTPRGRAIRRAYLISLYAHYEGFCKFGWQVYIDHVRRDPCALQNLIVPLKVVFAEREVGRLKQSSSEDFLKSVPLFDRYLCFSLPKNEVEFETSNLWAHVFADYNSRLGLPIDYIDENKVLLNSLVRRRNDIAHGQNVVASDSTLKELEGAAKDSMYQLAEDVCTSLGRKAYLSANAY